MDATARKHIGFCTKTLSILTNPWQFAAEAANVKLCEYLISQGADKTALAYEGPSDDAL